MPVDRRGLAEAHGVLVRDIGQDSALSVGNGSLCFTVDASGLQTWPERYPVTDPAGGTPGTLLGTLSDWGWHSMPGAAGYDVSHCARPYPTRRGPVRYADLSRELGGLAAVDITAVPAQWPQLAEPIAARQRRAAGGGRAHGARRPSRPAGQSHRTG